MQSTSMSWYSRAVRHCLPDISLRAPDPVKVDVEAAIYLEGGFRAVDGRIEAIEFLMQHGYAIWNLVWTARLGADTREYAFLATRDP
jgi:hypothetical protein